MQSAKMVYSHKEKLLLISLVDQFKEIVEDKRRDIYMLSRKQEVWQEITRLYNDSDVLPRSMKQLKKFWDNVKHKSKKKELKKMHVQQTESAPPSLQGHMTVPSIYSYLEADNSEDDAIFQRYLSEETSDVIEIDTDHDYSKTDRELKNGPSDHGKLLSTYLNTRTCKKGDSSTENEAELRLHRLNQQIKHDKEQHKLKMEILRSEYKQQKELHELKVKILQEELASKQQIG